MKGYIYVIKCKDENITDCYIGSTININSRKKYHKCVCNKEDSKSYNFKVYKFIRDNGGFDNFIIEVIKEVEINDKKELRQLEAEQYELLQPSLNCNNPLIQIDMKEYHKEYYKNKYTEYHKKRYQEKKDEYKTRDKKRYQEKKEEYKVRNKNKYKLIKTLLENYKNNNKNI
jgi:hypothetical protein